MLALPGPKLVNQSAKVVTKPKLVTKDKVEMGKFAVRRKLHIRLTLFFSDYFCNLTDGFILQAKLQHLLVGPVKSQTALRSQSS